MAKEMIGLSGQLTTQTDSRNQGVFRRVLLAGGWRLAKSDIADWTVMGTPVANTTIGYEIFGSNDAVAGIDEYFLKIVYTNNAGGIRRTFQVGYGYNTTTGALTTLAGQIVDSMLINNNSQNSATVNTSFISAGSGWVAFNLRPDASTTVSSGDLAEIFVCERLKNTLNAKNRVGLRYIYTIAGGSSTEFSQSVDKENNFVYPLIAMKANGSSTPPVYLLNTYGSGSIQLTTGNRVPTGNCFVQSYKLDKLDSLSTVSSALISRGSFIDIDINGVKSTFVAGIPSGGGTQTLYIGQFSTATTFTFANILYATRYE